jgi:hypothetical protein
MGYTSEKITRTVGLTLTRYKDYTYTGKTEEDYGLKITPPTRLVIIDSIKSSNGDESLWRSAVDRGLLYLGFSLRLPLCLSIPLSSTYKRTPPSGLTRMRVATS